MNWSKWLNEWWEQNGASLGELDDTERADVQLALVAISDAAILLATGMWDAERAERHVRSARAILRDIGLRKGWEAQTVVRDFLLHAVRGMLETSIKALLTA